MRRSGAQPIHPLDRHLHLVDDARPSVQVTAYSITGLLAVDKDGRISEPSPSNVADPGVEYHFQFTTREAVPADVDEPVIAVSAADVVAGPPPGASVHPRLAAAAESLRVDHGRRADMVRFTAPDGQEAWVGWDPDEQTLGRLGRSPSPLPRPRRDAPRSRLCAARAADSIGPASTALSEWRICMTLNRPGAPGNDARRCVKARFAMARSACWRTRQR